MRGGSVTLVRLDTVGFVVVGSGYMYLMLIDILIAVIIVIIAAVLGLVVHPLLWIIVIVAVLWLFARRSRW